MSFDHLSSLEQLKPARILLLVSSLSFCSESISQDISIPDLNNHFSAHSHAHLLETAEQLRVDGQLSDAEIVFKQLFTSIRANHGLFHEQQLTVLDRLIRVNLARADWRSLKQHLDYHDWLLNRLYADNALMLAEHLQISAWHHEQASLETTGAARNWHLVQTRQQLWRAVTALETLPEENNRVPPLLHQIALHHYALSRQSDLRWLTSFETRSDEPAMISGWAMQGNDVSKRSYEIGAELFARIIKHHQRRPTNNAAAYAAEMAQLLAYRGDWEMLFRRERSAFQFYEESLLLTDTSSCASTLQNALFGTLVELPVPTLALELDVCISTSTTLSPALHASESTTLKTGIYRPQWHQNQWITTPAPATLSVLNSEDRYD